MKRKRNETDHKQVRWMEIARRGFLLAGLIIGIWLIWNPVSEVYRVHVIDFSEELSRRPGWQQANYETLDDYIQAQTENRLTRTEDPYWLNLYRDLDSSVTRREPSVYANRAVPSGYSTYYYFLPSEIPVAETFPNRGTVLFVEMRSETGSLLYLGVNRWVGEDVITYSPSPPNWLLFPQRATGILILIAGVLLYLMIPRRRLAPDALYYLTGPAILGPDIAGFILSTGFFWLGRVLLVWEGWFLFPIAIILWVLGLFGVLLLFVGLWYATLWYAIKEEGIVEYSLKGKRIVLWNEIMAVGSYEKGLPPWMLGLFLLFGRYGSLSTQMAMAQGFRKESGIRINVKDQKPLIIMTNAFVGIDRLAKSLAKIERVVSIDRSDSEG